MPKALNLFSVRLLMLLLIIIVFIMQLDNAYIAGALEPEGEIGSIHNSNDFPVIFKVGGSRIVIPPNESFTVDREVKACIVEPLVYYISEDIRLVFEGLIVDGRLINSPCYIFYTPVTQLQPYYRVEVRVLVVSTPPGVYSAEYWGRQGTVIEVRVPKTIISDNGYVRHNLTLIKVGEVSFNSSTVSLSLDSPKVVTALYNTEYLLVVDDKKYWHSGFLLIPLEDLRKNGSEAAMLVPRAILLPSGTIIEPNEQGFFIISSPEKGKARVFYTTLYRVVVERPSGVEVFWVEEGGILELDFDREIQVSDREKLVLEGVLVNGKPYEATPINVKVYSPLTVEPQYKKYYLVEVESILGRSTSWVEEGSTFPLYFPPEMPAGIFTKLKLRNIQAEGELVSYSGGLGRVVVSKPIKITAIYTVEPVAWRIILATIPITLLSLASTFYIYRVIKNL